MQKEQHVQGAAAEPFPPSDSSTWRTTDEKQTAGLRGKSGALKGNRRVGLEIHLECLWADAGVTEDVWFSRVTDHGGMLS